MLHDRIAVLEQDVRQSRELARAHRAENVQSLQQQQQNLQLSRDLENKSLTELRDALARTERLRTERLRSADDVVNARQAYSDQTQRMLDLELQVLQLTLSRLKADEAYLTTLNRITERQDAVAELTEQLEGLAAQETQLEKTKAEAVASLQLQESELARTIEQLEKELQESREIRSEHDGRILELTAGEGKVVTRGQRLGTINARGDASDLAAVAYFKVEDGKRIKPGMTLLLTPATVERQRFGSVIARVTSVSRFAVSPEGVARVVGNSSVAQSLTKDGHQIEVFAELLTDKSTVSGYQWDLTNGPAMDVTSGTVATALATLEQRAPITCVMPILRY
jgi:HlyD family secretion protein